MSLKHSTANLIKMNACMAKESIRHPRTKIKFCGNPSTVTMSPTPWWISILCIVLGAVLWCASVHFGIEAMSEGGRLLLYGGIGNILGINLGIKQAQTVKGIK